MSEQLPHIPNTGSSFTFHQLSTSEINSKLNICISNMESILHPRSFVDQVVLTNIFSSARPYNHPSRSFFHRVNLVLHSPWGFALLWLIWVFYSNDFSYRFPSALRLFMVTYTYTTALCLATPVINIPSYTSSIMFSYAPPANSKYAADTRIKGLLFFSRQVVWSHRHAPCPFHSDLQCLAPCVLRLCLSLAP